MIRKNIRKGLRIPYPAFEEARYKADLLELVRELKSAIFAHTISNEAFTVSYNRVVRIDSVFDELERIIEYIKVYIAIKVTKLMKSLSDRAARINIFNQNAFSNFIKNSFGFESKATLESGNINNELKLWALENARLIKSLPDSVLDKLADCICNAVRSRKTLATLNKELQDIFKFPKKRAKVIARDQIAKLNGRLTRHRNLNLGITQYQWLSCRDERVRDSHSVLEGKICSWQDAAIYKNSINDNKWKKRSSLKGVEEHPGQDIMCRCTSIAIL